VSPLGGGIVERELQRLDLPMHNETFVRDPGRVVFLMREVPM